MGMKCNIDYTIQDLIDHFSYDPASGALSRKKRNKGLLINQDTETVVCFLRGKRTELSVNKVCFMLGTRTTPSYKVRKIDKNINNPLALNNLSATPYSQPYAVSIQPNNKKTEKTRVVWRVGTKYAQKTLQTPSDACEYAKKKKRELALIYGG